MPSSMRVCAACRFYVSEAERRHDPESTTGFCTWREQQIKPPRYVQPQIAGRHAINEDRTVLCVRWDAWCIHFEMNPRTLNRK